MIDKSTWLSAAEAAALLGVSQATLYAYVSRGLVRSEASENERRRRYRREDLENLRQRKLERTQPQQALAAALHFGSPLCESALTLIADGHLYYRGLDACDLARHYTLEEVAALLWTGDLETPLPEPAEPAREPFESLALAAAWGSQHDPGSWDLRPDSVIRTGLRILRELTRTACGHWGPCADALGRAWGGQTSLLSAALVLCADHELNISAFTARCVASSGASPWGVVAAALAALEGHRHGGMTRRVEALWKEAGAVGARRALEARLRRGEGAPGFGHPLYPGGDPRARLLLALLPGPCELAVVGEELVGEAPTIDLALVALAHDQSWPAEAALLLFALGRTVGWVAHALEQYATGQLIRPRARYTGKPPYKISGNN